MSLCMTERGRKTERERKGGKGGKRTTRLTGKNRNENTQRVNEGTGNREEKQTLENVYSKQQTTTTTC